MKGDYNMKDFVLHLVSLVVYAVKLLLHRRIKRKQDLCEKEDEYGTRR
jgi:hypothetical protein